MTQDRDVGTHATVLARVRLGALSYAQHINTRGTKRPQRAGLGEPRDPKAVGDIHDRGAALVPLGAGRRLWAGENER